MMCNEVVLTSTKNLYFEQISNITIFHLKIVIFTDVKIAAYCIDMKTNEPLHEKTNVLVSHLVQHKQGCTATKDG